MEIHFGQRAAPVPDLGRAGTLPSFHEALSRAIDAAASNVMEDVRDGYQAEITAGVAGKIDVEEGADDGR